MVEKNLARMTIKKAAKFLGITTNTLRKWEKSGKIVGYKVFTIPERFYFTEDLDKLRNEINHKKAMHHGEEGYRYKINLNNSLKIEV